MNAMSNHSAPPYASAVLVLEDGTIYWGKGIGSQNEAVAEICFNTSMTGYQEILSDPSYAGQIITFTFPHIGNVGTNEEDYETTTPAARGLIIREEITNPSNWRSTSHLNEWLKKHNISGITGIDTRALTKHIRDKGAPKGIICVNYDNKFDIPDLLKKVKEWEGLENMDLAIDVTCKSPYQWNEKCWQMDKGYEKSQNYNFHIVAIDFGIKRNIARCLVNTGCKVTIVPATTSAKEIMSLKPDGVFLSNGPGDPAATGKYAVPVIKEIIKEGLPIFGICLGHQMLSIALGAKTRKMKFGHRGGNHPVKDLTTGKVEITSQNHGFCVIQDSLPENIETTHISLFDKSNEGIAVKGQPIFSVQYHPEASPGPMDSYYLFDRFVNNIKEHKKQQAA